MIRLVTIALLLIQSLLCLGQFEGTIMFPKDKLINPIANAQWFENKIDVVYIDYFDTNYEQDLFLLENGYALYELSNKELFSRLLRNVETINVDIVFTHYPVNKKDWITNYYELLANRLKELFLIAPWLNSSQITWRLVKQTNCKDGSEAQSLFHGIAVGFHPIHVAKLNPLFPCGLKVNFDYSLAMNLSKGSAIETHKPNEEDYSTLIAILYPESIYNRKVDKYIPPRPPRPNDPSCPTFVSRMQKPKRRFLGRLFRR